MRTLYFCPVVSSVFFLSFLFPRLISAVADWMSAILPHMVHGLRSETCCTPLDENAGRKNSPKNRHLGTIPQLCRAMSLQLHISTIGKNDLLSRNTCISSTYPHNMVNFGILAAEIVSLVWGIPANFNGLRVLTARHSSFNHACNVSSQQLAKI